MLNFNIAIYKSLPSYICINPISIYVLIITVNLLIIYLWKTLLFGFLLFFLIFFFFGFKWFLLKISIRLYIVISENSNLAFLLWLCCAVPVDEVIATGLAIIYIPLLGIKMVFLQLPCSIFVIEFFFSYNKSDVGLISRNKNGWKFFA